MLRDMSVKQESNFLSFQTIALLSLYCALTDFVHSQYQFSSRYLYFCDCENAIIDRQAKRGIEGRMNVFKYSTEFENNYFESGLLDNKVVTMRSYQVVISTFVDHNLKV